MATYTAITDAEIDQDSPITQTLMTKYRDNLTATAEGAAGSPSVLGNIGANTTAGAIGSYVLARRISGTTDVAFGATLAGSSLAPVSAAATVSSSSSVVTASFSTGSALTGTWRCMGNYDQTASAGPDGSGNTVTIGGATLWIRIS